MSIFPEKTLLSAECYQLVRQYDSQIFNDTFRTCAAMHMKQRVESRMTPVSADEFHEIFAHMQAAINCGSVDGKTSDDEFEGEQFPSTPRRPTPRIIIST